LALTSLGTHDDRTGDQLPCQPGDRTDRTIYTKAPPSTECQRPSIWSQGFGQRIDNRYQAYADPRTTGAMPGFQAGVDLLRGDFIPGHMDYAGLYVAYANGNIDVSGLVTNPTATGYVLEHTGKLMLDAWSGGAYWSHIGAGGWHVDAVLQGTRYSGTSSPVSTPRAPASSRPSKAECRSCSRNWAGLRPRTASADPVATGILR